MSALSADPIILSVGGGCCPLSVRMYVNKGGGGGGHHSVPKGGPWPPLPPLRTPLHVLHVHVYIVPTMLAELLYPLQDGRTPLHLAAKEGRPTYVERLLSTPGTDVNIKDKVSWSTGKLL